MESVLIVSTDKAHAEQLTRSLVDQKISCAVATSGKDGYQRILRNHPDLVILSNTLPDMKIEGFLQLIRSNLLTRTVPILIVANTPATANEETHLIEAGANDYLSGAIDAELLAETVRRTIAGPKNRRHVESAAVFHPKPRVAAPAEPPIQKKRKRTPLPFLKRVIEMVFQPRTIFGEIEPRTDLIITLMITALTPILASVPKLFNSTGTFDAWISAMSLGLMTSALVWFALAGLLHMTLPFQGEEFSLRECLIFAGLASVPKLFGALMSALYAVVGRTFLPSGVREFGAGLNLIPNLPDSDWVAFVSRIGVFDVWSAWLICVCFWTLVGDDDREWNATLIIVGVVALVFGALTSY